MEKSPYKRGFTLIELIVVTAILGVIGMTVFGTFVNGISIWKTVTQESSSEDVNLFFEKISHDLRNSFKLASIRFNGEKTKASFPVYIKVSGKDGIKHSIGQVKYSYDRRKKTIIRNQLNYSEVYRKKAGADRILVEEVNSMEFDYFIYNEQEKKYSWVTHWQDRDETFGIQVEDHLPLIVRVSIKVPKDKGHQKYVKHVQLPSGCCWPFEEK